MTNKPLNKEEQKKEPLVRVACRLSKETLTDIKIMADKADITLSEFLRKICIKVTQGEERVSVMSSEDKELLSKLILLNTDIKRIGNLFKYAISKDVGNKDEIASLIRDFNDVRVNLSNILYKFQGK